MVVRDNEKFKKWFVFNVESGTTDLKPTAGPGALTDRSGRDSFGGLALTVCVRQTVRDGREISNADRRNVLEFVMIIRHGRLPSPPVGRYPS